ncbi:MAG: cobalamin B12-binding domain-containing protein [Dehalogenimonas sp.]
MPNHKQIAELVYTNLDSLAAEITTVQQPQRADISPQFGLNYSKYAEYARHDLYQLTESLIAGDSGLFSRYKVWQHSMMVGHKVPTFFVQMQMDAEATALSKLLSSDQYAVVSGYFADAADALSKADDFSRNFIKETGSYGELAQQYLSLLLVGDRQAARELIIRKLDEGAGIADIYLRVFQPALYEVGRLWQTGRITVAHEHFCSAATQLIMSELYSRIQAKANKKGQLVVAACVAGELHEIGLRMSADLLELAGWRTLYIGANTPPASIIAIAREQNAKVLALSMALPSSGPALREMIAMARQQLSADVKIIVGGYILAANPKYAESFKADGIVKNAGEAVDLVAELVRGVQSHVG